MLVAEPWNDAKKILCIRLDSLGDVLMTTPAIRAVKESLGERRITILTSPAGAQGAALVPEIDAVITYEAPWMKATAETPSSKAEYAIAEQLRKAEFDAAIIFTVYSQNPLPAAFLCHLAEIPLRLAHCRENPYQLLSHWVCDPEPTSVVRHEVRRQIDLVASVGCRTQDERLSIRLPEGAGSRVSQLIRSLGVDQSERWVVVHPGASAPSRRYSPEGFAEAAQRLYLELGCQIIFTGNADERPLIGHIQDLMAVPSHSVVGMLTLVDLAALLQQAPLLIANNTGPVHIAAAVGTPVVDIYALTNPQHTPWGVPNRVLSHDVPCKYCYKSFCPEGHHDCLRLIPPAAVFDAAADLLSTGFQDGRAGKARTLATVN
ncbi:MAG: glycosyltransferase family 9 protein [Gemmataceae bacterium]